MSLMLFGDDLFGMRLVDRDPWWRMNRAMQERRAYRELVAREAARMNALNRVWSEMLQSMDDVLETESVVTPPETKKETSMKAWHPFDMQSEMHLHVEPRDGSYAVVGALPENAKGEDVKVRVVNGLLTVEANKSEEQTSVRDGHKKYSRTTYHVRESVSLPRDANASELWYEVKDGQLEVRVPRMALTEGSETREAESTSAGEAPRAAADA